MEPESILLVVAAILLIIDLIIVGRNRVKLKQSTYGFYACLFSFSLIVVTYLSFLAGFVTSDFSLIQVYSYTQSGMTLISKIYATWAGSAGSILLLILFTSTAWFSIRLQGYKKQNKSNYSSTLIVGVVVLFFIIASLMMNPFARYGAEGPVEGRGLNPALQSVWMAIHPPIVFAGYTFIVVAFSLMLAKMKTGLKSYERLFSVSVKAGWLFLTLGIGLGGLWAYEVLGWGGYWSWDPIETASLLPWAALTGYFIVHRFSKGRSLTGEFSILLAFFSLMFLSALTRGGLLQSVHAYGLSPAGPFILVFVGLMVGYFFYLKWRTARPLFGLEFNRKSLKSLSAILALVSLLGIFLVCFSGIVYSMVAQALNVSALEVSFYNYANFPFVVALFFALIGYSIDPYVTPKKYFVLIVGVSVFSVALVLAGWPTGNIIANSGLPLVAAGLCAGAASLLLAIKSQSARSISRSLIHLGFVVVLLGVFVSSTTQQVTAINDAKLGSTIEASGLSLTLNQCVSCTDSNSIELKQGTFPQSANLAIDSVITDGLNRYNAKLSIYLYTAYGFVSQPTIIRTGLDDVYVHVNTTKEVYNSLLNSLAGNSSVPETFTVTVEKNSMINIVWIGVAMLFFGGFASLLSCSKAQKSPRVK